MSNVRFTRHVNAPIQLVWDVLADHRGMTGWTPLRKAALEREGDPSPNGLGAIRKLSAFGPPLREEIVEFAAPHRFAYRMLFGAPVRDYVATVELTETGGGTDVAWGVNFIPRLPGVQLIVRGIIARLIKGLAAEAERRASSAS